MQKQIEHGGAGRARLPQGTARAANTASLRAATQHTTREGTELAPALGVRRPCAAGTGAAPAPGANIRSRCRAAPTGNRSDPAKAPRNARTHAHPGRHLEWCLAKRIVYSCGYYILVGEL
jgi:hypothetical protein